MSNSYDIIIVGGGPAGLFAAYFLLEHSNLSVLLLEKGTLPEQRSCPIINNHNCLHCNPCNILSGMGGAGLFSDGKLNFIHKLGKTDLTQFLSRPEADKLIEESEEIFNFFGMDGEVYPRNMDEAKNIRKTARKEGIELLLIKQKHLGSDSLPEHLKGMVDYIRNKGLEIKCSAEVQDVLVQENRIQGVITSDSTYYAPNVILAPGRVGSEWLGGIADKYGLNKEHRGLEIGVRVEVHNDIMRDLTDIIYDPTFFVQTSTYDDQTRTFCTNRGGYVTLENYQNFVCVNGHAYKDKTSDNTNFAFLSKVVLTEPVTDNQAYGESIGNLASLIGGGKAILQRLGDLKRGRRSTWGRIKKGYIEPTLDNVVCGDIAMGLPARMLTNIEEGLKKLNLVVPGVANDETLLYAPEIKFFATQIETDNSLQTGIEGLYIAGDGGGVAGNIVAASATGLIPAKSILEKLN